MKVILRYVALPLLILGVVMATLIVSVKMAWGYSPIAVISVFAVLLISIIAQGYSVRHSDMQRGWRVGHQGRDQMVYEEFVAGRWEQIIIDGTMLYREPHHVIYLPTNKEWDDFPEWARGRRSAIVARIKTVFTPPDYEYEDAEQDETQQPLSAALFL